MKIRDKGMIARTVFALTVTTVLVLVEMPQASAHKIEFRPRYVHDHHLYYETRAFPRWLKKDRGFKHWYVYNRFRFPRRMSWHRLYDCYLDEQRRYRRARSYRDGYYYYYKPRYRKRR